MFYFIMLISVTELKKNINELIKNRSPYFASGKTNTTTQLTIQTQLIKQNMKKILGIFLASALIWSCGSQFSKSKYDRFMWNRSQGKEDKTVNTVTEEEMKTEKKIAGPSHKNADLSFIKQEDAKPFQSKSSAKSEVIEHRSVQIPGSANTSINPGVKKDIPSAGITRPAKKSVLHKSKNNPMQAGDVDAMWIVTLILCLIIPPLGVYLKDGSITGLFWVVLILCLLGGGLLGVGGFFGGFYGIGAILALLRFFDII